MRFVDGLPVTARSVTQFEYLRRWCQRNPVLSAVTGLAASLAILFIVGLAMAAILLSKANSRSEANAQQAKINLLESRINEARAHRTSSVVGRRQLGEAAVHDAITLMQGRRLNIQNGFSQCVTKAVALATLMDLEQTELIVDQQFEGRQNRNCHRSRGTALRPLGTRWPSRRT